MLDTKPDQQRLAEARFDVHVDRSEVELHATSLHIGMTVEFALRTGRRGRLVVTNVAARKPAKRMPEPSETSAEAAVEVWEGEGGAVG